MALPIHVETALLSPIKQYITRIEWLDWNENVTGDYTASVIDGSISVDNARDVRRNFSLTIDNASGLFIPYGSRANMGIKVRLQRGIKTSSSDYWWPKGIYVLTDPEAIHRGAEKIVNLNGVDKWALYNGDLGGTLTETTVIARGTNVGEAIKAVAQELGETKFAFDVCDVTTPYTVTKEPGETRADLMKELALIASWDLFYDLQGYLRFRPLLNPIQKQVVADLSSQGTYRRLYVDSQYSPEWSKIRNYWKVIGYSDSDTGIIYDGQAQNNNPLSPTNTAIPPVGIGIKADVLKDENLTTDSLCDQRAAYELRKNLTKIDRSSHSIIPLPFLNDGDCVQLEDEIAGIEHEKYEIQAINEPLRQGLMTLECWKSVNVYELVLASGFQTGIGAWQQLNNGNVDIFGIEGNNCLRKSGYGDPSGGYCLLNKPATDFEFIAFTRRDVLGTGGNQYSVVNSLGTGYGIGLYYNGTLRIEKRTAWSVAQLTTKAFTPSLGQWYTLRLSKISSNLVAEVHLGKTLDFSNPLASSFVIDMTTTSFDRVAVNGGYVYYTDDVLVRKLL